MRWMTRRAKFAGPYVSVPQYRPKPPSLWMPGATTHEVMPLTSLVAASVFMVQGH